MGYVGQRAMDSMQTLVYIRCVREQSITFSCNLVSSRWDRKMIHLAPKLGKYVSRNSD